MKFQRSKLFLSFLVVTLSVNPVYAQDILTEPGSVPVPTTDLETANSQPTSASQPAPATVTDFLAASPLSPATPQALVNIAAVTSNPDYVGVTDGATVSGVVNIGPNLTTHPDVRKVAYYLNGAKSGKVYTAPYLWGGPNGTGTAGFDTKTLADGSYTLGIIYTDSTGDHSVAVSFQVNNTGPVQPVLAGITDGTTVSGTITVGPDLTTFGTILTAEYLVDGISTGISTVSPFTWGGAQGFDTKTLTNATHALNAVITDNAGAHQFNLNFTVNNVAAPPNPDFVGVTDGAVLSGIVNIGPNLTTHPDVRKVAYYLDGSKSGKVYAAPYLWGGPNGNGTAGFDTKTLADGTYTLGMIYTDGAGDHSVAVSFQINNAGPVQPALSGITAGTTVSGVIAVGPVLSTFGTIQKAEYFVDGVSAGISTVAPFTWGGAQGFDTTTLTNATHAFSAVITDNTGAHSFNLNFTVNNAVIQPALSGITNGTTVSGTIMVGPELSTFGTIQKAEYFIDGVSTGISTVAPFTLGGSQGFDTKILTNATHTLSAVVTDNTGAHSIAVSFTVNNTPPPTGQPVLVGLAEGAMVTGIIKVGPDLSTFGTIQKVEYFIEGEPYGAVTTSPFTFGGSQGFDTARLVNYEEHTITVIVTDNTGAHELNVHFHSNNTNPNLGVDFTGIQEYQMVSGVINIGPNLALHPDIRKVAYYLDFVKSGKVYSAPFTWGGVNGDGTTGFDTRTLPNGVYVLGMTYTDSTGDHAIGTEGVELDMVFFVNN